jgi:hypothetical protein
MCISRRENVFCIYFYMFVIEKYEFLIYLLDTLLSSFTNYFNIIVLIIIILK